LVKWPKDAIMHKIDDNTFIFFKRKMTALEKLKAIPIGRRIKVSSCDTLDVQYVIWRTGENEYKVDIKKTSKLNG